MKLLFNPQMMPQLIKNLWKPLLILLVAKLFWFVVLSLWLNVSGHNHVEDKGGKALYYRVKLSPNEAAPPTEQSKQTAVAGSIRDIVLLAIYNASDVTVVTVEHKRKTKVLSRGEAIDGFVLEGAGSNYATFSKDAKTYKVPLLVSKKGATAAQSIVPSVEETPPSEGPVGEVTDAGDHKIVDKSLINHYAKNMEDIYKNIGIVEVKKGDVFEGFRISFIRKGSAFEKLGVKRGDVIKSINGEKMDSYNAAFGVYKNISNINNLSLVVERGNQEVELEYEVD